MSNVVVAGGGYAGVLAASRLSWCDNVAATLINPPHAATRPVGS